MKPNAIFIMSKSSFENVFSNEIKKEISMLVNIENRAYTETEIRENLKILEDKEIIISSWGMVKLSSDILDAAKNLKAVFYAAGSIKYFVTEEMWDKGIAVTSAYAANAVPVAEFTVAEIILSLKRFFSQSRNTREQKNLTRESVKGSYGANVGIISTGMIGSLVCQMLKSYHLNVFAYDIFPSEAKENELGIKYVSLEEIFKNCDVVSLHTPWLKETENMITGKMFESMKKGSTFINTARGAVINEKEMIEVLEKRPDLVALLDVSYPEPPIKESPLYTLPNVVLTPHIAGTLGDECLRMAEYTLKDLQLYIEGKEPIWAISREKAKYLA